MASTELENMTTKELSIALAKDKPNPIESLKETPSMAMPVQELSSQQPKSDTDFVPEPQPTNFSGQLADIRSQAEALQTRVNDFADTPEARRESYIDNYLATFNEDLADDKAQLRADAQLAEKETRSRNAFNRMKERDDYYRDEIERLEKNPDGMLRGALNAQIADVERLRSREMADLSFAYQVANGDFLQAQKTVDTRIADMEADLQREAMMWEKAIGFLDLTDREKLEIQNVQQEKMAEKQHQYNIEIAQMNDRLARERAVFNASLAAQGEQQTEAESTSAAFDTIDLVRGTISRITGTNEFDPLYKASGANRIAEFVRKNIGSSATDFTRLNTYVDTLKSNMLMLGSDPAIRDFFGPQMSERDVDMMMASATNLQPGNQQPSEVLAEVQRIEDFIGKYESAVKAQALGADPNRAVVTAPDGVEYVFVD